MKILNKDITLPEADTWSIIKTKSGCLIYILFRSEIDAINNDNWLKAEVAKLS